MAEEIVARLDEVVGHDIKVTDCISKRKEGELHHRSPQEKDLPKAEKTPLYLLKVLHGYRNDPMNKNTASTLNKTLVTDSNFRRS